MRWWLMVTAWVGVMVCGLGAHGDCMANDGARATATATAPATQAAARLGRWVEREVRFKGADGVELAGTVLTPDGEAKGFVLLIQGSGPTDRDGNQPPALKTDLLKGIAYALGDAGVGSLRVDSRACASMRASWPKEPEKIAGFFTMTKMLGDVEAGWKAMGELPEAKGKKRVVLGHSQGGVFALALEPLMKPDAVVLMATPGRGIGEVVDEQLRNAMERQGVNVISREWILRENARLAREVKETGQATRVPEGLRTIYNPSSGLFLKDYVALNPAELALSTSAPTLVVQGEMDKQISAAKDAPALMTALEKRVGPGSACAAEYIKNASHNFKRVRKMDEDGFTGEVMPEAREAVVKWVERAIGK